MARETTKERAERIITHSVMVTPRSDLTREIVELLSLAGLLVEDAYLKPDPSEYKSVTVNVNKPVSKEELASIINAGYRSGLR